MASSYSNATGAWKKQQTGVLGLAKDTVDKLTGKDTRKNMQASVHSAYFLVVCSLSSPLLSREGGLGGLVG